MAKWRDETSGRIVEIANNIDFKSYFYNNGKIQIVEVHSGLRAQNLLLNMIEFSSKLHEYQINKIVEEVCEEIRKRPGKFDAKRIMGMASSREEKFLKSEKINGKYFVLTNCKITELPEKYNFFGVNIKFLKSLDSTFGNEFDLIVNNYRKRFPTVNIENFSYVAVDVDGLTEADCVKDGHRKFALLRGVFESQKALNGDCGMRFNVPDPLNSWLSGPVGMLLRDQKFVKETEIEIVNMYDYGSPSFFFKADFERCKIAVGDLEKHSFKEDLAFLYTQFALVLDENIWDLVVVRMYTLLEKLCSLGKNDSEKNMSKRISYLFDDYVHATAVVNIIAQRRHKYIHNFVPIYQSQKIAEYMRYLAALLLNYHLKNPMNAGCLKESASYLDCGDNPQDPSRVRIIELVNQNSPF